MYLKSTRQGPLLLATGALLTALTLPLTAAADDRERHLAFAAGVALGGALDGTTVHHVHAVQRQPGRLHAWRSAQARYWRHGYPQRYWRAQAAPPPLGALRWHHGRALDRRFERLERHSEWRRHDECRHDRHHDRHARHRHDNGRRRH